MILCLDQKTKSINSAATSTIRRRARPEHLAHRFVGGLKYIYMPTLSGRLNREVGPNGAYSPVLLICWFL